MLHDLFQWWGHLVFSFRSLGHSLIAMTALARHAPDFFDDMWSIDRAFVVCFSMSFVWLMFVVVFGLILAVLMDNYKVCVVMDNPLIYLTDFQMYRQSDGYFHI